MKVGVLGAGAIGSMLGGLIKHHRRGSDVMLIARGEHGRAIRDKGHVRLQGPWGTRAVSVDVSDDVAALAGSDCILITVKSHDTEQAIAAAVKSLAEVRVPSMLPACPPFQS